MKLFLLLFTLFSSIFLVASVENKWEIICIPNATFHIDCNRCKCSPTGMSIDCTDWTCATLQISHDLLLNLTLSCHAGEILLYNGLKCLCSPTSGYALCSSGRRELAHNLRPADGPVVSAVQAADNCTPGLVFKAGCDTCICSEAGKADCLGLACLNRNGRFEAVCNYPGQLPEKVCVPGTSFSVGCNRCICSDDGFSSSCDRYPCLGVEIQDEQILNITFRCEASTAFLYNRHECLCSKSGKYALCSLARLLEDFPTARPEGLAVAATATRRTAWAKVFSIAEARDLCTPGVLFKDECNVCVCGNEETASCTQLDCGELARMRRGYATESPGHSVARGATRILGKNEIWLQRKKNVRFCKKHYAALYCKFMRAL